MSTLRECFEILSDEQLREIIRQDLDNEVDYPVDTILLICEILAHRNPVAKDAKVAYQQFIEQYIPSESK